MRKKILIMENANHYQNITIYHNILSKRFIVNFYLVFFGVKNFIKLDSPNLIKKKKKIINAFNHKIFFFRCFFIFKKFDYYFVTYAPEQNKLLFLLNLILFYIFCLKSGKKIILRVADGQKYIIKKNDNSLTKLMKLLRINAIKKIKFLVFENETLEKSFKKSFKSHKINSLIIRPTEKKKIILNSIKNNKQKLVFGIPGILDEMRRDYVYLIKELKKIDIKLRKRIIIKFIGSSTKNLNRTKVSSSNYAVERILDKISNIGFKVILTKKGYLSRKKYSLMMKDVDFLIDINKKDQGYFFMKSTGLITDAYNYSKRVILCDDNDPYREFKNIAIYYHSLSKLISNILNNKYKFKSKTHILDNSSSIRRL